MRAHFSDRRGTSHRALLHFGHTPGRAIDSAVDRVYAITQAARREGYDPEPVPEIPRAHDMSTRVEKLLAHLRIGGIAEEIRALAATIPREEAAVTSPVALPATPRARGRSRRGSTRRSASDLRS